MARGNISSLKHFKPQWQHGQTRTIRVPVVLADQVLELARLLDQGVDVKGEAKPLVSSDSTNNKSLEAAIAILQGALELKPNAGGAIKKQIRAALEVLINDRG